MTYGIGIDLGGTSIKALAVTPRGRTLAQFQRVFAPTRKMDWATRIRKLIRQIEADQQTPAAQIGVAAPGLAAPDGRSIAHMPGRLHGLEGLDWTGFLGTRKTVPVLNDAHAALLGESWLGAAKGFQNVIMLTLGTGVGGAAIVDGRLLRGYIGRAGHLGHICLDTGGPLDICGTPGSLEMAIGNCTIKQRSGGRFKTTHGLVAAHLSGDGDASKVWLESVKNLACAIGSFINLFDPDAVIIGGGIARAGTALFEPLQRFLDPIEWRPGGQRAKILAASLGEFAGAIGAARFATRRGGADEDKRGTRE